MSMEHFPSGSPRHQPSFVKIYLPDQTSTTLGIPPAFIENFNGKIPKRISLNNLSGRVWPAKLGYIDKKLHITDGWTPYVKEHSLKCGEFVVFTYLKKSTFLVKAYGVDGLIKQEPLYKRVRGISPNVAPVRNMRFFKTLTVFKRQLGVPKHIIDSYALTLPQKIKLRGDKGKSVKTKLRQMKDRVILGFGLAKFWKRNGVQPGDRLEFEVIRGDDDKIEEIVMKNLSQSEEFGRDY